MPNKNNDILFLLIKSLEKAEKRNFKLFITRNSASSNLLIVTLFDAIDKMNEYDETQIIKKHKQIKKAQLSNLKTHLYKQILTSLRVINSKNNAEIELNEQMDFARILYNKGLYLQSLKLLDKIKETAKIYHQNSYIFQALQFEKKIESLHITRSISNKAQLLRQESELIISKVTNTSVLASLALELYGWYIQYGHARDKKDEQALKSFFDEGIKNITKTNFGFYENLYFYQAHCWYAFIVQDLLLYYRNAQRWVNLFEQEPVMKDVETGQYIRALHNLLTSLYNIGNYNKYKETLISFESFYKTQINIGNQNNIIQTFIYLYINKINLHFLEGSFKEGLTLVPIIENTILDFKGKMDNHRILIFYYKIACLYFGNGDNDNAVIYLNKIIQFKVDLRTDLQCYARLLHLIAHYELGNFNLIEYLIKSVYRFMAKLKNLNVVEEEVFNFLRKAFSLSPKSEKLIPSFIDLKHKLVKHQNKKIETRSFMYLDIISWLESKIEGVPVQRIIQQKFTSKQKG